MQEKDELLAAIEKNRKEAAIVTFFRDPLVSCQPSSVG